MDARLERLERAVREQLAVARVCASRTTDLELEALRLLCVEHGAVTAWWEIRRYFAEGWRGEGHTSVTTEHDVHHAPRV